MIKPVLHIFSIITWNFYPTDATEAGIWSDPSAPDFFQKSFDYATHKELDARMKFLGEQFLF